MQQRLILFVVVFPMLVMLAGCGFHLRGSHNLERLRSTSFFIEESGAPLLKERLYARLVAADIMVNTSKQEGDIVVFLSHEKIDRITVSVSPTTGKARQYELRYTVNLTITEPDEVVAIDEEVTQSVIYLFDVNNLTGEATRGDVLRQQLLEEAVNAVSRRLARLSF